MSSTNNLFYSFCVSPDEWIIFDPDDDKLRHCEYECWGDDDYDIFDDRILDPSIPPPVNDRKNGGDGDGVGGVGDDFALFRIPGDNVDTKGDVKNCLEEYYRQSYEYASGTTRGERLRLKDKFKYRMKVVNERSHSYNEQIHDHVMLDRRRFKRIEPPEVSLYYWSVYANYRRNDIQYINAHIHPAYEVFSNWYLGDKGFEWTDLGTTVKNIPIPLRSRCDDDSWRYAYHHTSCPYDNRYCDYQW